MVAGINMSFIKELGREKSFIHILRQIIATVAASLIGISAGLAFGFSAVLLPQLKSDDRFPYDAVYESWIAAVTPLAMAFGCLCVGTVIDKFGRKGSHYILSTVFIVSWVVLACATTNPIMILGRFLLGLCTGANRPVTLVYIGEISDPKYRTFTLFCPSLSMIFGVLLSHIIGTYCHWKTSSLIFCAPSILCFVSLIFVEESPLWLISKGKIEEGEAAFKWFRKQDEAAEIELKSVLEKQKCTQNRTWQVLFSMKFIKPLLAASVLSVAIQCCGVNVITIYAQDILRKTFPDGIDIFVLMIIIDCIRLFSSSLICFLGKILPRKKSFLLCCFVCCLLLLVLVIYLYISPQGSLWLPVTVLLFYMGLSSALVCLGWTFITELFPDKIRGFGSGVSATISFTILFIVVKFTPVIIEVYGEITMYAIFGIVTFISALALCFILPETNCRSLQDIHNK